MDNTILLDLVQSIGELRGQNNLILAEQGRAADGRKEMYRKLDAMAARAATSDAKLDAVALSSSKMEPIVADYEKSKYKAVGMLVFATGLASVVGFFASEIRALIFGRH